MKKVTQTATARRVLLPSVQNAFDLGIAEAGGLCSAAWLKRRRRAGVRIICRASSFSATLRVFSAAGSSARRPIAQEIRGGSPTGWPDEQGLCRAVSWALRSNQSKHGCSAVSPLSAVSIRKRVN